MSDKNSIFSTILRGPVDFIINSQYQTKSGTH